MQTLRGDGGIDTAVVSDIPTTFLRHTATTSTASIEDLGYSIRESAQLPTIPESSTFASHDHFRFSASFTDSSGNRKRSSCTDDSVSTGLGSTGHTTEGTRSCIRTRSLESWASTVATSTYASSILTAGVIHIPDQSGHGAWC